MASIFQSANATYGKSAGNDGINSSSKSNTSPTYKYEMEFQELQTNLLCFPEKVALRLTKVDYELFKQVQPIEYLCLATLDMNNFKGTSSSSADVRAAFDSRLNRNNKKSLDSTHKPFKCVQDLINIYKEVSSWIKKLIQSQSSFDKRLAIILSHNLLKINNYNSAREIWLELK